MITVTASRYGSLVRLRRPYPCVWLIRAALQGMSLDAETVERLRLEMESKRGSGKAGKHRGPVDSGKGVRIQVRRS